MDCFMDFLCACKREKGNRFIENNKIRMMMFQKGSRLKLEKIRKKWLLTKKKKMLRK